MLQARVNPIESEEVVYSSTLDHSMPGLNEADRTEIRGMIANSRSGGIPLWIKESLALTIVMLGSGFIISHYIPAQIGSQTSAMAADIGSLKESVTNLKTDTSAIKADLGDIRKDVKETLTDALHRAYPVQSSGTKKIGNLDLGNKTLELANSFRVTLDPVLVNNFGEDAIRLAAESVKLQPAAWKSVQLSLNQRTNQEELRAFINSKQWWEETNPLVLGIARGSGVRVLHSYVAGTREKKVPFESCAIIGQIGTAEQIFQNFWKDVLDSRCPQYFRFADGEVPPLDGTHLKNVVLENVRILYRGGPVILDNVIFLNCSFDLSFNRQTEKFAEMLLTSKEITFRRLS